MCPPSFVVHVHVGTLLTFKYFCFYLEMQPHFYYGALSGVFDVFLPYKHYVEFLETPLCAWNYISRGNSSCASHPRVQQESTSFSS